MVKNLCLGLAFLFLISCNKDEGDGLFHDFGGKFVYSAYDNHGWKLQILDKHGQQQITNTTFDKFQPEWVLGGQYFICTVDDEPRGSIHVFDEEGTADRRIYSPGLPPVFYGYDVEASLSPDGQLLAIALDDTISLFTISGDWMLSPFDIIYCKKAYNNFKWAPDSKKLACINSDSLNDRSIFIYKTESKSIVNLNNGFEPYIRSGSISWSHNSDKIAFSASGDIYSMQVDGSDLRNLTQSSNFLEEEVTWSPNEDRLVYERADSTFDIVILNWTTNTIDVIFDGKGGDYVGGERFIWLENGKYIAYNGGVEIWKENGIYLIDIGTKVQSRLTNFASEYSDWKPD